MYEVIVLGATFAAAGIAEQCKHNCLILERRAQAGYEFFGALQFDVDCESDLCESKAIALQQQFLQRTDAYDRSSLIYPYLQRSDVLFGVEIVVVEKTDSGFCCKTYGIDGFRSFEAKKVVDTRCSADISTSKYLNILIESEEPPVQLNTEFTKAKTDRHYILHCPIPLSWDYPQAREAAHEVIKQFSEMQKLILSANTFDYQVRKDYPKTEHDILYLPSKAYENPVLAFEAGLHIGKEMTQ